jgi:NitT/TauT family transport system substrate-binding protein
MEDRDAMIVVRRASACVLAVSVCALAACGRRTDSPGARPAATPVRMAVGGQNQLLYLPITLARELGYYKDAGLDVDIQDFGGGSKALESLLGGSADVVSGFYDHTIQMAAEGRELVAFVAMLRFPGLVLTTSPSHAADIASIADLRGRIVGVTAAGSSTQMILTYLLGRHGVPPASVSIAAIGAAATAIAAVEHGRVDAAMMAEPAFTMVQRRNPQVRVLADLRRADGVRDAFGTDSYMASVLYSTRAWTTAHADTARRLARAIARTLDWMQGHTPAEIAAKMPPLFRGNDEALYVEALGHAMPMYSPDGRMSAEAAGAVRSLLADSLPAVRDAPIDVTATFTNDFLR